MTIDVRDLPARWPDLWKLIEAGTEVVLVDGAGPRARLVPVVPTGPRVPGLHPGALQACDDFDAPLSDDFWLDNK